MPLHEEVRALKELVGFMEGDQVGAEQVVEACRTLPSSTLGSSFSSLEALSDWRVVDLALTVEPREDFAREVAAPPEVLEISAKHQAACEAEGVADSLAVLEGRES